MKRSVHKSSFRNQVFRFSVPNNLIRINWPSKSPHRLISFFLITSCCCRLRWRRVNNSLPRPQHDSHIRYPSPCLPVRTGDEWNIGRGDKLDNLNLVVRVSTTVRHPLLPAPPSGYPRSLFVFDTFLVDDDKVKSMNEWVAVLPLASDSVSNKKVQRMF